MENNMAEQKEEVFYGTVLIKAKEIMDFILESRVSPTLKEISENVDMTKSTVLKILKTLEHCGYVRRTEDAKQYYLGTMFLAYAQKVNHTFDIRQIAMPHLATLVSEIEETVNLGIVENQQITLLDKIESNSTVYLVARVGGQMHMYSSSMGKAILAEYSDDEISRYVSATSFEKLTPNTMTDISSLIEDVGKVKKRGYAFDNEENQPDIFCVGFSLCKNNHIYGAFSVSMPKYRASEEKIANIIEEGKKIQAKILSEL
jgi:DNA-binding IclR family transcriptional regulator